jgi:hypothetical protein
MSSIVQVHGYLSSSLLQRQVFNWQGQGRHLWMQHKLNPTVKGTVAITESLSLDIPRSIDREINICLTVSSGLRKMIFIDFKYRTVNMQQGNI